MKKSIFHLFAAALVPVLFASCVPVEKIIPEGPASVSLSADPAVFGADHKATVNVRLSEAGDEDATVILGYDANSALEAERVKFPEEVTVKAGETEASFVVSFDHFDLKKGEYDAIIRVVAFNGEEVENVSVTLLAVIEKKTETPWTALPEFKAVKTFPTITITTDGSIPSKRVNGSFPYVTGRVVFSDPDGMYSDVPVLEGTCRVRKRGNTTANNAKYGMKIKLDEKSKVFGMRGDRDWAILAEWSDGTLLRNQTAMQVSRIVGMQWTPKCCSAEVTLNGKKLGVFTLIENKEIGDSKIPMGEGGYYLELDDKEEDAGSNVRFTTPNYYKVIKFKDPEAPDAAMQNEVKSFFTAMEETLASNSTSAQFSKYKEIMDVDSFIRNFIVQELCKNVDGNLRLSTPLVLENNVLRVPMVWDFDLSLGNGEMAGYFPLENVVSGTATGIRNSKDGDGPTGWFVKCAGGRPYGWENPNGQTAWYQRMFRDPELVAQLKTVWNSVYPDLKTVPGYSNALYSLYSDAIQREWDIWRNDNYGNRSGARMNTPKKQQDAMVKFYSDRLEWMNSAVNNLK